jgi:hypothetical protein
MPVPSIELDFTIALDLLIKDGFDRDKFIKLAAAVPVQAQKALQSNLKPVGASQKPEHKFAAETMLAALWRIMGCEKFVEYYAPQVGVPDSALEYVWRRLQERPNDFSNKALKAMRLRKERDPLGDLARKILRERLESFADQLPDKQFELSADVEQLKQTVRDFGFSPELNETLAKVEAGIGSGDAFDQAALLKHLRTFFEQFHRECGEELRRRKPETIDGTPLGQCGQAIDYLVRKDVLTDKMGALGRGLYGVLSEEGVHKLKAEREYVRLCWNMVVEYGKVLLFELERAFKRPESSVRCKVANGALTSCISNLSRVRSELATTTDDARRAELETEVVTLTAKQGALQKDLCEALEVDRTSGSRGKGRASR